MRLAIVFFELKFTNKAIIAIVKYCKIVIFEKIEIVKSFLE